MKSYEELKQHFMLLMCSITACYMYFMKSEVFFSKRTFKLHDTFGNVRAFSSSCYCQSREVPPLQ